jgi:hypothetical protein
MKHFKIGEPVIYRNHDDSFMLIAKIVKSFNNGTYWISQHPEEYSKYPMSEVNENNLYYLYDDPEILYKICCCRNLIYNKKG